MGLVRYGLHWNGPTDFICTEMADGYWTPWHIAQAQLAAERERADISADRNYIAGMQAGFRLGLENDNERLATLIEFRRKNISEALQATAPEQEGE